MILRKPYAFLIKNFKLIHLVISLLIVFLINKTNLILNFLGDYIRNDVFEFNASNYVNILVYLVLLLIIGLVAAMIILMRKKQKPLLFYIFTIIVYSVLLFGFTYVGSIISTLEFKILDRKTISLVRDITRFMLIGQSIFLIPFIIRTLGFDIKKFDFKKDLQELDIDISDDEEFELLSPVDFDKVKKKGRRRVRELKYYYVENKLFIIIILSIIGFIIGINIINNIKFHYTKKYNEQEIINLDNYYTLTIDDSYIVTKDENGKNISVKDNSFLVVKFTAESKYKNLILDSNKFILKLKGNNYIANKSYYNYFKNYGIGYKGQKFNLNDKKTFILVYVIPSDYKKKKMTLEYEYGYNYNYEVPKSERKIVKLEPEIIN